MSAAQAASAGQTALAVLDEARANLQKVFLVFLLGLVGTIWGMRAFVWDFLRVTTEARMEAAVAGDLDIIVRTPFDVILLQIKIGLAVGILLAIPLIIYYGRAALLRRGMIPDLPFTKRKRYALLLVSGLLGLGGVIYAYLFFFPFMFQFLAESALISGLQPQWDIVMWTEFLILLTISFGLAAQIPLFMTAASYTEIIRYETFRDKWKYAILGIFLFGAVFSPPDPFTQLMWGVPLVLLYFFSLALAKLAANLSRAESAHDPAVQRAIRRKVYLATAAGLVATVAGAIVARFDLVYTVSTAVFPSLPPSIRPAEALTVVDYLPRSGTTGEALFALNIGLGVVALVVLIYAIGVLRRPIPPSHHAMIAGDPADLDLRPLDTEGLRAAPWEAFAAMDEDDAVSIARSALQEGDTERAEVVLERFDEAQAQAAAVEAAEMAEADETDDSTMKRTATGIVDAFTEEETTEDDIGGYWYDLVFIYESLTSRMFRLVLVFLAVTFGVFYWLYAGGIGQLRVAFLARIPPGIDTDAVIDIITLHPVEHLLFAVKISLVIAVIAVLPLLLYYAWPALGERGFVSGDRRVFLFWGGLIMGGLVAGSLIGFVYIAPVVISALVWHSLEAGMVISYRIQSFAWLVFFTTIGIGLLFNLLVSMVLFHVTGIVRYETFRARWRGVVVWSLIFGALFTPGSVLTLLIVVVPTLATYAIGLGLLWIITAPGRILRRETAIDPS